MFVLGVETRELTQLEVQQLWHEAKDEECRIELLRQAFATASGMPAQIEILAQALKLKPTTL